MSDKLLTYCDNCQKELESNPEILRFHNHIPPKLDFCNIKCFENWLQKEINN